MENGDVRGFLKIFSSSFVYSSVSKLGYHGTEEVLLDEFIAEPPPPLPFPLPPDVLPVTLCCGV